MFFNPANKPAYVETNDIPNHELYKKSHGFLPPAWEFESDISAHNEYRKGWGTVFSALPREKDYILKFNDYYFNCILDQDESMYALLIELKRLGLMENTIIIFTSDHGEMAGSHGLKGKGPFMFEYNIHVPLIIAHPAFNP